MGPYQVNVGCPMSTVFVDDSNLVTTTTVLVGDSNAGVYTFINPAPTVSWCGTVSENFLLNPDNTAHVEDKVTSCNS